MKRTYYPPGFSGGTGYQWDEDDDEAMPNETPASSWYFCAEKGHKWADTGMKWTYCTECDAEGMWNMENGYQLSDRKRFESS